MRSVCIAIVQYVSMHHLCMAGRLASDCARDMLQMRWHLHVPVNAFFVAVTLLQNSYVCRAAWPGVPGALLRCSVSWLAWSVSLLAALSLLGLRVPLFILQVAC